MLSTHNMLSNFFHYHKYVSTLNIDIHLYSRNILSSDI